MEGELWICRRGLCSLLRIYSLYGCIFILLISILRWGIEAFIFSINVFLCYYNVDCLLLIVVDHTNKVLFSCKPQCQPHHTTPPPPPPPPVKTSVSTCLTRPDQTSYIHHSQTLTGRQTCRKITYRKPDSRQTTSI